MICGIYRDYHFPLPLHGTVRDETDIWEENCLLQDQQNQIFGAFAISYSDQPEPVPELYVEMRGHDSTKLGPTRAHALWPSSNSSVFQPGDNT